MKNVLLIGDSIRAGYDKSVKKSLEGVANVYFPEDNSRFASYTLRYLGEYKNLLKGEDFDVVHWNAGLWDCLRLYEEDVHTPIDIYAYYIERICVRMKKIFPKAEIIFATSTRVQEEKMHKSCCRHNKDIEDYNRVAVEIVKKYGFLVNDLYEVSKSLPVDAHSDAVHYYTPIGTKAFTDKVLLCISSALGIDEKIIYQEEIHTAKPVGI